MPPHIQNPEQSLILELQAAACGQPLPSQVWQDFANSVVDALGGQGSQNWPLMAAAVAYVQTGANSPVLLTFFKKSEDIFMGTELLSPTYSVWGHLLPVCVIHAHAVKVGDLETAAAAMDWLRFFWSLVGACTAPDGSILSIGWRASPWQDPERDSTLLAWVRDVGLAADLSRWEAAAKRLGLGLGQSPARAIALAVQGSLTAGLAPAPIPAYRTMTPLHRLSGDGWFVVYLEENGNGNTPPRMAGKWIAPDHALPGTFYLPSGSLTRVREQFDHGTVKQEGSLLTFNSSIYGRCGLALPGLSFAETVLGTGDQVQPDPLPAPSPVVPPSTGKALDFAALAAVVAALQVPGKQRGLRDHLAEQIREAPEESERAGLADALETLGIGDGQDQAVGWKAVIKALREPAPA